MIAGIPISAPQFLPWSLHKAGIGDLASPLDHARFFGGLVDLSGEESLQCISQFV